MYPNLVIETFKTHFGAVPKIVVRAPGRINLIGEHTDYNGGYVLPAAIDKAVYFAVSPREDDECHFIAHDLDESFTVSLKKMKKNATYSWANYLMGVLDELQKELLANSYQPIALKGVNLVFGGDIPSGGGVSSSAAIENGIGFAVNELFNLGLSRVELFKISQRAENNFVGMKCGIMDMFASMMGKENAVIRLDCRSLKYQYFPFDAPDYRLVLCNTTVKHSLVDSEYNTRRAECEEGVALFKKYTPSVKTLRNVHISVLLKHKNELRPIVFKRCKYVIEEIVRVEKACKALQKNHLITFGQLMFKTHEGLQNEYEVSCKELDFLVEKARQTEGVLGARMMGGGFGGCTINLVQTDAVEAFIADMKAAYKTAFDIDLPCFVTTPKNGVEVIA
ncbi:MAG: galactokinase [Saprospiraceae bacterium]|nr:galactokinase [Saprospiraceae bacterium]